jgi:hypothetical protein
MMELVSILDFLNNKNQHHAAAEISSSSSLEEEVTSRQVMDIQEPPNESITLG